MMLCSKKSINASIFGTRTVSTIHQSLLLLCLTMLLTVKASKAQEVRLFADVLAVSGVDEGFRGLGAGIESAVGKHFSVGMDVSLGFTANLKSLACRPQALFYLKKGQTGLFLGPSLSYMHFVGRGDEYEGSFDIYGAGLAIGVKGSLSDRSRFHIGLVPQLAIGDFHGTIGSAAIQAGIGYRF